MTMVESDEESREPHGGADCADLFSRYLDYYRAAAERKITGLPQAALRLSRLPTGWTPIELLKHLVYMEQRWFVWGFLAEQVADPWGDRRDGLKGGSWDAADAGISDLCTRLRAGGERTREILATHELSEVASLGGRFSEDPPTLSWICFHVLQEYARHLGHLDIAVELAGGKIGQ